MKAILKYPLYRRPQPTNEVDANGYLPKGSVIEVERIYSGKYLDGISIWFYSNDGFYYWGGGLKVPEGEAMLDWESLNEETKSAILSSIINDEAYRIEKKVIGLLGYGMGYKNDNKNEGLALTIFVDAKIPKENFDKTISYTGIKNIPVDIKPVRKIEHQQYVTNGIKDLQPDKGSPMQMGGSISVTDSNDYGTRSFIVRDKNKKAYLMTCFHVLLDRFRSKGQYPFPGNIATIEANYPCKLMNNAGVTLRKEVVVIGKYNNNYDFALITLTDDTDLINAFDNRSFNGFYISDNIQTLLGKELVMGGATSKLQMGKVLETKSTIFVGRENKQFDNVIVTEKISMPGDSGAPVIDDQGMVVGIIIAGSVEEKRSYILPIHNIVFQQGYTITN
ncbi:MAG: trypsin-like peptidase domain-containing protein [Sphingobacteriales bacterium]|nr:trypsin-like peptidase domain-containing protein [Sphingobacteriales bacterium]MBI3720237.1 trypsin-like peptidase domain-containing protein [Sphingobacteriales bacterium]